ncbi:DUF885 domain-containing protein [Brevundimonas sp.]|uniref:DUF885 domain-containing protein n=1 Tax=Brevundimonas sp. TaxID=1871086 RepID=UPI003BA8B1AE
MIDRRRLLAAAMLGAAVVSAGPVLAGQAGSESARLAALLERLYEGMLDRSPTTVTYLGLDKGSRAAAKSRLDPLDPQALAAGKAFDRQALADLKAIDRDALSADEKVSLDSVLYSFETQVIGYDRFDFGSKGYLSPYRLSQLTGAYRDVPDFLDTMHTVETDADARAYLNRLGAFAVLMDQETALARIDLAAGITPPDFIVERTLEQMRSAIAGPPAELGLVTSLARRTEDAGLSAGWAPRATAIVVEQIIPAAQRQIDLYEGLRAGAVHDAGVWRLPVGEGYYGYGIRFFTTTALTGDEVHEIGLAQVAEISARADAILKAEGRSDGSVGARLAALGKEPQFIYPNTPEGKAQLLADLNTQVAAVTAKLPEWFGRLPKAGVEIRAVPAAIEAGAPGGYAMGPSLDGSRPGAYYINLRDTAEWPKWTLPTLTYHEATPGHVMQGTLAAEAADIPMIRKLLQFSAYGEGWGLYSEQLADEMGMYEGDPWGQLGYLQSMLFRATRLVVDSGLHHKRWSREQAIRYMVDTLGDQESSVTTEVERYCIWPGQACSYKIGHNEWVRLREGARAELGDRFDIRSFHDTMLNSGDMPLAVFATLVDDWVAARKAA